MPSAVSETMRGSSPLARGLPAIISSVVMMRRIIPARAGFTPPRGMRCRAPRDHPRSRGVYVVNWLVYTAWPGSSPLARGLRLQTGVVRTRKRIIPARAGFTTMSFDTDRPPIGSSPLARGLLVSALPLGRPLGIIPARAGFTRIRLNGRTYVVGSSPLARGLPTQGPGRRQRRGIIPARAGFTDAPPGPHCRRADHPRSRGVYRLIANPFGFGIGSSPLARGLLATLKESGVEFGIIPARAGFTKRRGRTGTARTDHPRSRGVYKLLPTRSPTTAGSSPLARGLRSLEQDADTVTRIIPARAGFTTGITACRRRCADHPRSRGVYAIVNEREEPIEGSSPLARGLLGASDRHRLTRRIIPARAGFTSRASRPAARASDHPRSRGVYDALHEATLGKLGSSPLARGLRAVCHVG